ncbi:MAG: NAD(P)-binding protein [Dehalococcoidia bacterium]|nr:NAD(P)-binding protein [Dehalococcoidia bacterium]
MVGDPQQSATIYLRGVKAGYDLPLSHSAPAAPSSLQHHPGAGHDEHIHTFGRRRTAAASPASPAAIHAAREGAAVTLFERADDAGGRARSQVEHGFTLNLGPHALYPAADRELRDLGIEVSGRAPAAGGHALASGRLSLLPAGAGSAVRTRLLSARQKVEFAKVFRELTTVDPAQLATARLLDASGLRTVTRPGRGRQLVETYMRLSTYANAPHLLDAGATIRNFQSALPGVRYLDGGWGRMVERLRDTALEAGVTIGTGTAHRARRGQYGDAGFRLHAVRGWTGSKPASVVLAGAPATAASMLDSAAAADARTPRPIDGRGPPGACRDAGRRPALRCRRRQRTFLLGRRYARLHPVPFVVRRPCAAWCCTAQRRHVSPRRRRAAGRGYSCHARSRPRPLPARLARPAHHGALPALAHGHRRHPAVAPPAPRGGYDVAPRHLSRRRLGGLRGPS